MNLKGRVLRKNHTGVKTDISFKTTFQCFSQLNLQRSLLNLIKPSHIGVIQPLKFLCKNVYIFKLRLTINIKLSIKRVQIENGICGSLKTSC